MPGEYILTFPGSYHAGFSTGINVGEAVNFVSRSWFDFGFKCQEIYRKTREKIPVLPIDWLIIENIMNLEHSVLDHETLIKLRESYAKILKEERYSREIFEKTIKEPEMMEKRDDVAEDQYQCYYCTDYSYVSVVQCRKHKINYCIHH
jgi:histone demethylase JARID1